MVWHFVRHPFWWHMLVLVYMRI
jgi:hypothetical protein